MSVLTPTDEDLLEVKRREINLASDKLGTTQLRSGEYMASRFDATPDERQQTVQNVRDMIEERYDATGEDVQNVIRSIPQTERIVQDELQLPSAKTLQPREIVRTPFPTPTAPKQAPRAATITAEQEATALEAMRQSRERFMQSISKEGLAQSRAELRLFSAASPETRRRIQLVDPKTKESALQVAARVAASVENPTIKVDAQDLMTFDEVSRADEGQMQGQQFAARDEMRRQVASARVSGTKAARAAVDTVRARDDFHSLTPTQYRKAVEAELGNLGGIESASAALAIDRFEPEEVTAKRKRQDQMQEMREDEFQRGNREAFAASLADKGDLEGAETVRQMQSFSELQEDRDMLSAYESAYGKAELPIIDGKTQIPTTAKGTTRKLTVQEQLAAVKGLTPTQRTVLGALDDIESGSALSFGQELDGTAVPDVMIADGVRRISAMPGMSDTATLQAAITREGEAAYNASVRGGRKVGDKASFIANYGRRTVEGLVKGAEQSRTTLSAEMDKAAASFLDDKYSSNEALNNAVSIDVQSIADSIMSEDPNTPQVSMQDLIDVRTDRIIANDLAAAEIPGASTSATATTKTKLRDAMQAQAVAEVRRREAQIAQEGGKTAARVLELRRSWGIPVSTAKKVVANEETYQIPAVSKEDAQALSEAAALPGYLGENGKRAAQTATDPNVPIIPEGRGLKTLRSPAVKIYRTEPINYDRFANEATKVAMAEYWTGHEQISEFTRAVATGDDVAVDTISASYTDEYGNLQVSFDAKQVFEIGRQAIMTPVDIDEEGKVKGRRSVGTSQRRPEEVTDTEIIRYLNEETGLTETEPKVKDAVMKMLVNAKGDKLFRVLWADGAIGDAYNRAIEVQMVALSKNKQFAVEKSLRLLIPNMSENSGVFTGGDLNSALQAGIEEVEEARKMGKDGADTIADINRRVEQAQAMFDKHTKSGVSFADEVGIPTIQHDGTMELFDKLGRMTGATYVSVGEVVTPSGTSMIETSMSVPLPDTIEPRNFAFSKDPVPFRSEGKVSYYLGGIEGDRVVARVQTPVGYRDLTYTPESVIRADQLDRKLRVLASNMGVRFNKDDPMASFESSGYTREELMAEIQPKVDAAVAPLLEKEQARLRRFFNTYAPEEVTDREKMREALSNLE